MLTRALIGILIGFALPGGALARCEDYNPQPKPQNTFAQDVGRSFDRIVEEGWIEFAVYENYAPWSYEEKGKPAGVDIDIGRVIAKALGLEAKFRLVASGENLEADLLNYVWKGAAVGGRVSDVMLHVPYDSALVCRIEQVTFTGQYAAENVAIAYRAADYAEKAPSPALVLRMVPRVPMIAPHELRGSRHFDSCVVPMTSWPSGPSIRPQCVLRSMLTRTNDFALPS